MALQDTRNVREEKRREAEQSLRGYEPADIEIQVSEKLNRPSVTGAKDVCKTLLAVTIVFRQ